MPESAPTRLPFQPIGQYKAPGLPAQETFRRLWGRFRRLVLRKTDQPFIAGDHLQHTEISLLDSIAGPPECGPLSAELDLTLTAWLDDKKAALLKLIVLPPGDENNVVESWARDHGHRVISPPGRTALLERIEPESLDLGDGSQLIVIPRLEAWFLRERNGLHHMRALLKRLDALEYRCVLGCNSWAWAFLETATQAQLVLPDAVTFHAYDAERLHHWLAGLTREHGVSGLKFRLPESGADVFELTEKEGADKKFFGELAAASLGIPWVAWRLWRRSLRTRLEHDGEGVEPEAGAIEGEQTLWVAALDDYTLPGKLDQTALHILQALLIHGSLSDDELRMVLPLVGEMTAIHALLGARLVIRENARYRCEPTAYPAIRAGLLAAGYPKDRL